MKLNGIRHLLAYTNDVNLMGGDIDTINESTETLINVSKDIFKFFKKSNSGTMS
jgi:thiamine pyrophosphokinase